MSRAVWPFGGISCVVVYTTEYRSSGSATLPQRWWGDVSGAGKQKLMTMVGYTASSVMGTVAVCASHGCAEKLRTGRELRVCTKIPSISRDMEQAYAD